MEENFFFIFFFFLKKVFIEKKKMINKDLAKKYIYKLYNLFRGILVRQTVLLTHGRNNRDQEFLTLLEILLQLLTELTFRELDIILGGTIGQHQREETIINVKKSIFHTDNVRDIHVVSGRTEFFVLSIIIKKIC